MKNESRRFLPSLFAVLFSFGTAWTVSGATKIWTNISGGSWATVANWTPAGTPGAADAVFICSCSTRA